MDFDILQAFLRERGYQIALRRDGWTSVRVTSGDESWVGEGDDEAEALCDAVSKMFPSKASWALLGEELYEAHVAAGLIEGPDGEDAGRAFVLEAAEPEDAGSADEIEATEPATEPAATVEPPAPLSPSRAAPPKATPPARPHLSVADALDLLGNLCETIDALLPEVAWMSPLYVQKQLTCWLARARSTQEKALHAAEVEREVRALVGRLGQVSKRWWPGSVIALQLNTTPEEAAQKLHLKLHAKPSWDEVADAIELLLEDAADGWADGQALEPRPSGVDDSFRRIVAAMEDFFGGLVIEGNTSGPVGPISAVTGKAMKEWAQRLRWMRGVAPSGERWAQAMGRLRWASQHSDAARRMLAETLNPATTPTEGTWAKALNEDPETRQRQRLRRELLREVPSASAGQEQVAAWLAAAFSLGTDLNNRQIAGLLREHHPVLLALTNDDLGVVERNVRSRLRKLQKALHEGEIAPTPAGLAANGQQGETDGRQEEDAEWQTEPSADPVGDLIAQIRARVMGKSAIFVSNRTDNDLKERLERRLGLTIEWCDGSPRRVQSAQKQIQAGTYGLVILATGFTSHTADAVLSKASKAAGVPFVRAYKGRPLATVRALARDLGLRHEGH